MTTNGSPPPTVGAVIARLTAELGDVSTGGSPSGTEFRRGGQVFAVLEGSRVALKLRPDIAEAALRTTGTSPSSRGDEWIEFDPNPSDQHDVDRLQAWLTIGWRSAQRRN
jgi:hypothetical protein